MMHPLQITQCSLHFGAYQFLAATLKIILQEYPHTRFNFLVDIELKSPAINALWEAAIASAEVELAAFLNF